MPFGGARGRGRGRGGFGSSSPIKKSTSSTLGGAPPPTGAFSKKGSAGSTLGGSKPPAPPPAPPIGYGRPRTFCCVPRSPSPSRKGPGQNKNRGSTDICEAIGSLQRQKQSKELQRTKARGSCILMDEIGKAAAQRDKRSKETEKRKSKQMQLLSSQLSTESESPLRNGGTEERSNEKADDNSSVGSDYYSGASSFGSSKNVGGSLRKFKKYVRSSLKNILKVNNSATLADKKCLQTEETGWKIVRPKDYEEMSDIGPEHLKVVRMELRPVYATHPKVSQPLLLPDYDKVMVTEEGYEIRVENTPSLSSSSSVY